MANDTVDGIRFVGELQRLDVKPGDRFVISVPGPIPMEACERIRQQWKDFIGGDVPVLILSDGIKIGAISGEQTGTILGDGSVDR